MRHWQRFADIGWYSGLGLVLAGAVLTCFLRMDAQAAQARPSSEATTLVDAMRTAQPAREVAIAVGADKIFLPRKNPAPDRGLPLSLTVTNFDYMTRRFGGVVAIAPLNRVILSANLPQADIYKDIPPREAFSILAASLSDGQRQAMLNERGLGLADLTSRMQRGLFLTLFPGQSLSFRPRIIPGQPAPRPDQVQEIRDPMQNARLRVGASTRMVVHTVGRDIPGLTPVFADPNGPKIYDVANQKHLFSTESVDGAQVHWTEANDLKKGQLDFDMPALQQRISLSDLKTVEELIARIAAQTKLELYADRHYETRSLTLLNASGGAKAADLLRALCLCLTGAFRRVGPAYVLTDDVAGVGARRQRLVDFQADGAAQRAVPLQQAEDYLQNTGALWKTKPSGFGDPMLPTAEQMQHDDKNVLGAGTISVIKLNFDQLTSVQKQALQGHSADLAKNQEAHPNDGNTVAIDFDRPVELNVTPSVQLLLPGIDGPIDTDLGEFVSETFTDMSKWRSPRGHGQAPVPAVTKSEPPLIELAAGIPRRALLTNARTPENLESVVGKMKQMGLNQLWLPIFCSGVVQIPGSSLSSRESQTVDLLTNALRLTKGSGIEVYPVLDLLSWGKSPERDCVDLTITGETSYQDAARRLGRDALRAAATGDPAPASPSRRFIVSPIAPTVQHELAAIQKLVSERSGIAGIVWRETCPSGYDTPDQLRHIEPLGRLGYTETARLAFLRQAHVDPLDITPKRGFHQLFERADTSLPLYDDYDLDGLLDKQWRKYCNEANVGLLSDLFRGTGKTAGSAASVPGANGRPMPVVFVRERRDNFGTTWYGAWGGPNTLLPTNHMSFEDAEPGEDQDPAAGSDEQAHSQSRLNIVRLPTGKTLEESILKQQWATAIRDIAKNKKWEGFVFEMESIEP